MKKIIHFIIKGEEKDRHIEIFPSKEAMEDFIEEKQSEILITHGRWEKMLITCFKYFGDIKQTRIYLQNVIEQNNESIRLYYDNYHYRMIIETIDENPNKFDKIGGIEEDEI